MLIVSPQCYETLKGKCQHGDLDPRRMVLSPIAFSGESIRVDSSMPFKKRTGKIIQKDRFADYDASDMDWAEPLGLAEWELEDCHCVMVDDNTLFTFRMKAFHSPIFEPRSLMMTTGR